MSDIKRYYIQPEEYATLIRVDTGQPLIAMFPDGLCVTTIEGEIARVDEIDPEKLR